MQLLTKLNLRVNNDKFFIEILHIWTYIPFNSIEAYLKKLCLLKLTTQIKQAGNSLPTLSYLLMKNSTLIG